MSIRIKDLPPKTGFISSSTQIASEDPNDETNKTRKVSLTDSVPYTWGASDEDAPLSTGILYTTEAAFFIKNFSNIVLSLKNAPTGNDIEVDVLKETAINSNIFASIFSVLPKITVNQFTSQTGMVAPVFITNVWEQGRRLQIKLTINDANFAATGLKVAIH